MSAKIELGGEQATIEDYVWTSPNQALADWLNALLVQRGEPSGSDPNPDCNAAEEIAKQYHGKLLECEEVEGEPGVVY